MIVTKDFLQNTFNMIPSEDYFYYCICMIDKNMNEYQKFKATFISKILNKYKNICTTTIYFLTNDNKLSSYDITSSYLNKILLYSKRLRNIRNFGHDPEIFYLYPKPSHSFLYPNMKHTNSSTDIQQFKTEYAHQIHEITLLPKLTADYHNIITSFLDDNLVSHLNHLSDHDKYLILKMIELYKDPHQLYYISELPIELYKKQKEYFVDFETVMINDQSFIYWIGVYSEHDDYQYFLTDNLSRNDEYQIMSQFTDYISDANKIFYWHAEKTIWKRSRHTDDNFFKDWIDLCIFFRETPILIKNCFNFKLKNIAHHMKKMNMIDITCPSECQDGKTSMIIAQTYFNTKDPSLKKQLYEYNCFDCVVMHQILSFFRN